MPPKNSSPDTIIEGDIIDLTLFPSPFTAPRSKAKEDWEQLKGTYDVKSKSMDSIMEMLGIEDAKFCVVKIASRIIIANYTRGVIPLPDELTVVFKGNPGVGKKTIANHYIQLLCELNVCRNGQHGKVSHRKSGNQSASTGGLGLTNNYGYTATIEEGECSYSVIVSKSYESWQGLYGGKRKREDNLGLTIHLQDHTEYELYQFFVKELSRKFEGKIGFRGFSINGTPTKVLVKRIASKRGTPEFRNVYATKSIVLEIIKRQYARLMKESKIYKNVNSRVLTKEDLLGPPPSTALENHAAWNKLQAMVGLKSVKTSVQALIHQLHLNYYRELAESPPIKTSLNRVFLGNPGTGKTTVAKLYAEILATAGFLSSSEVVVKTPADFIGAYIGHSEEYTMEILEETKGKVLVIDEAYMLGNGGSHEKADSFRAAVIDTIVGQIQGNVNEDRCVLLLGYREQMEKLFRDSNPGLARRFPLASAFEFEDYTHEELREILEMKLTHDGLKVSDDTKQVAMDVLERARNSVTFGNAGEIDILLTRAKERQHTRLVNLGTPSAESLQTLEASDMDENFDRIDRASSNIKELFSGMVGSEALVEKLEGYQKIVQNAKSRDFGDPRDFIPFNFIFRGPPGTGKTTTARKMGQVYYDLGFLATIEVVECSVSDLIGIYIGQTGPKVRKVFEKALGKVLFIDEAYRLSENSRHSYASEAVGEIVDILTQEKFRNKLVVILAGYEEDMNKFLSTNPGLTSRFSEVIDFNNLTSQECRDLLFASIEPRYAFKRERRVLWEKIDRLFDQLASLPFWGNARDVKTLARSVMSTTLVKGHVDRDVVSQEVNKMLIERQKRALS
ncbi:ATPases of the AAA+ class [Annulohypoxylon moriforme]|nr:ATPases of the AAA+ class [Annulohypoxylon moriforme]